MLSTTAYLSTQGELHLGAQRRSLTGSPMTIRVQMAVARLVDGLASPDLSRFWEPTGRTTGALCALGLAANRVGIGHGLTGTAS